MKCSDRGSVILLCLIPFLIGVGVIFCGISLLLSEWSRTEHHCRNVLLRVQEVTERGIQQLFKFNSKAESLMEEEEADLLVLRTSVDPYSKSAAATDLARVKAQQALLRGVQKSIKIKTQYEALSALRELKERLRRKEFGPFWAGNYEDLIVGAPRMSVIAQPPSALAPTYKRSPYFEDQQNISARWSIPIWQFLPSWILSPIRVSTHLPFQIPAQCSATIRQRRNLWQPMLSEARSYWR